MNSSKSLSDIRAWARSLGYEEFVSPIKDHAREVWLRRRNDHADSAFTTILNFEYKSRARAYTIWLGVVEDRLRELVLKRLSSPSSQRVLSRWRCIRPIELPCWNLFDVGRGLGWMRNTCTAPHTRSLMMLVSCNSCCKPKHRSNGSGPTRCCAPAK